MDHNLTDRLVNYANVLIVLLIVLLYVVTGTGIGDDAVAAFADRTVYRGKQQGAVALECVVQWDAEALPAMLDTLQAREASITFFVSGRWASENAALLERMVRDGHEIGTAGYLPAVDGDASLIERDVEASVAVIARIAGTEPGYYHSGLRARAPSQRAAVNLGMTHIACTADLLSARGDAADVAFRAASKLFDGSILLLAPTAQAADALPAILDMIGEKGYRVSTVGEILK